ncbi:MAG TPA: HEAT repeat domain-containing protein [Blastocatellia bacterium]|nr:HEAT repeat domain-containing protein [Blastocatellia bacterium]
MKAIIPLVIIITTLVVNAVRSQTPTTTFTTIEGANLRAKLDAATRQGQARGTRYWVAYSFDVRPNVTTDSDVTMNGNSVWVNGVSVGSNTETRNLAVFLLYDAATITRIEIYNLDRKREYSGYPVFWLGRANNEESLSWLQGQVNTLSDDKLKERATMAIALHDDKSVGTILKGLTAKAHPERVRKTALFWLGHTEGEREFLADFVRNEQEPLEIRKQAAFGIGISKDPAALTTLQSLYAQVAPRELKRQILFATSINANKDGAVDFLINTASNEQDRELKKQAMFWLGQKAGERSLKFLGDVVEKNDGDVELQKQAIFAISQRQKNEAVPLLIRVAQTHPSLAVRKQAIFWLGQSGDERAVAYFKELFAK